MAGDSPVRERIIVSPVHESTASDLIEKRVEDAGGRVFHRFGPQVLIAELPEQRRLHLPEFRGVALGATAEAVEVDTAGLDETGALGLAALKLRETDEFLRAKARRPLAGEPWDAQGAMPPDAPPEVSGAEVAAPAWAQAGALPTSGRLMGKVAVGVIIVQGPSADLQFTEAERTKIVAEVQNGLTWLGSMEPSRGVSWSYEVRTPSITATRGPDTLSFAEKEERWRNPTMAALGFSADWAGVGAYVSDLRTRLRTDWAYCAFFTRYPIGHFGYASIGGPRLVMDYNLGAWTVENMDRVFAHETGHIFGAPDEYASSGCNCSGEWGFYRKPNSNCENCAAGGGMACIMKANEWSVCPYTPAHLGWGPVPVVSKHSGKVLDVNGWSTVNGANIVQWDHHGGANQQFRPDPVGGGYFRIVSLHSGKVLDVNGWSRDNGARIVQWDYHGGDNQLFRAEPLGDGYYRIISKHSGKALDVSGVSTANGAQLVQWDYHGGANQRWRWISGPVRSLHSGRVFDVNSWSRDNGARIVQWDYHGGGNQQFRLDPIGGGYYRIVNLHSGKVLDVSGWSTANGAHILQWDYHGGDNQLFRAEPLGDGYYRIISKHSRKALEVYGWSTANGAQIVQWDYHGGANQRWRL